MININCSLRRLQSLHSNIYLLPNDLHYDMMGMAFQLLHHSTHILKEVRKAEYEHIRYHICSAFSWSLAIAGRLHLDITDKLWEAFPGVCPYCKEAPCSCRIRRRERQNVHGKSSLKKPTSVLGFQRMFWKIYPNVLPDASSHLAEEVGEVITAIRLHNSTHDKKSLEDLVTELIDVITNIFAVTTCLNINLASSMVEYFTHGCPRCKSTPCDCGYIIIDEPIEFGRASNGDLPFII